MTDELKSYRDFFNQLKNCKTTNRSFLKDLYTLILEVDEECSKNTETLKFIFELRDFINTIDIDDDIDGDDDEDEDDEDDDEFEILEEQYEQLVSRIGEVTPVAVSDVTTGVVVGNGATLVATFDEPLKDIRSEMIDLIDDFLKVTGIDTGDTRETGVAAKLTDELIGYYETHEGLKKDKTLQSFLYEFLGYMHKDFDATIDDLKNHNIVEWEASIFEKCKTFRCETLSKVMFKPVAIKGLDFCYKCKGDEFTYWQAQTRGNDEQTTTFKRCIKCNF